MKDKKTFEQWKRDTQWGQLFAAYERGDADRVIARAHRNGTTAAATAE
jgi:hypothetical protein